MLSSASVTGEAVLSLSASFSADEVGIAIALSACAYVAITGFAVWMAGGAPRRCTIQLFSIGSGAAWTPRHKPPFPEQLRDEHMPGEDHILPPQGQLRMFLVGNDFYSIVGFSRSARRSSQNTGWRTVV